MQLLELGYHGLEETGDLAFLHLNWLGFTSSGCTEANP